MLTFEFEKRKEKNERKAANKEKKTDVKEEMAILRNVKFIFVIIKKMYKQIGSGQKNTQLAAGANSCE